MLCKDYQPLRFEKQCNFGLALYRQLALTVPAILGCASCVGLVPSAKSVPTNSACTASDIQAGAAGWIIANPISAITRVAGNARNPMPQPRSIRLLLLPDRSNEPCMDGCPHCADLQPRD